MQKLNRPQDIRRITALFACTYMTSYMTRINFGAIVSEMSAAAGITKSLLSMSLTGSFIAYGTGQVLSGILGDRFSPKALVGMGLGLSAAMNLLLPLCPGPYGMLAVWSVNGLAQAFLWPPMVRMMTALLMPEDYKAAVTKVSWGSSFGTIAIYLTAPILIAAAGWKSVFWASAAAGVLMLLLWSRAAPDVQKPGSSAAPSPVKGTARALLRPLMLWVMAAIVLQGMLRDGITTWMPSFIGESFGIGTEISILSGVLLPVFSILCFRAAQWLYQKKLPNPLAGGGLLFGLGALCALALTFCCGTSAIGAVLLSAALTGCMHGVNLLLVCMVPAFFEKEGSIATVSGTLNACTYIGSALSTYGIAALSEGIGWQKTVFLWCVIALAGCLVCFGCTRPWRKNMMEESK